MTKSHVIRLGVLVALLAGGGQGVGMAAGTSAPPAVAKGPALPPGTKLVANLNYGDGRESQLLDIYIPENKPGPHPLVVWIHGGGWANGDKSPSPSFLQMLPMGFAVASINYRLSGEAPFPAQIYDCKGAIRWLRAHGKEYNLNVDRIGVWGISAGGHLVALLGTSGGIKELEGDVGGNLGVSSRVQAVSDYAGPSDIGIVYDQAGDDNVFKSNLRHKGDTYFESLFGGGSLEKHKDLIKLANPINYITSDDPPFQIFHGDKDTLIPVGQSEILAEALKAKGVSCVFTSLKGMGHGFGQGQYRATFEFFQQTIMSPTNAVPAPAK